jgi:ComF family protein
MRDTAQAKHAVHRMVEALLDLVFAPVCLGCDGSIATGDSARLVCRRCRSILRSPPAPRCPRCAAPRRMTGLSADGFTCPECTAWPDALRCARAACLLEPPADRLVHQLKYRGWRALASPLGERMAAVPWPDDAHESALVIPVPTTARRIAERGYNQAAMLAAAYAAATSRTMADLLRRAVATRTQTTLQPAARAANVAGAFTLAADVSGRHVILVDDVLTTGATAAECANTLHRAGACCIRLITFARAFELRRPTRL